MALPTCSKTMSGGPPRIASTALQNRRDSLKRAFSSLGGLVAAAHHPGELRAVDVPDRAELLDQLALLLAGDDADRVGARELAQLRREHAEAAGGAPDQHAMTGLELAAVDQHPVRGEVRQAVGRGLLPREVLVACAAAAGPGPCRTARTSPSSSHTPRSAGSARRADRARAPRDPHRRPGCSGPRPRRRASSGSRPRRPSTRFRRRPSRRCGDPRSGDSGTPTRARPSAAQTLLKFTPAAITRTTTSNAPGSGTSISSSWKASMGSPKRSSRMTQAAIVRGSSPGSVSRFATWLRSTATRLAPS